MIAAHQFFIERRRTLRPFGEMRPASGEEWDEFEQHFLLRRSLWATATALTEHLAQQVLHLLRACTSTRGADAGSCASTPPSCHVSRR